MSQLALFVSPDTVPSPLCCYDGRCPRQGRAQIGPAVRVSAACVNRDVVCECGRTGTLSTKEAA